MSIMRYKNKSKMISNFFKIIIVLILPLLIGCNQNKSDPSKGFTIVGNMTGINDGTVYLMKAGEYLGYTFEKIDSTKIIDGRFALTGTVNFPEMYYLTIEENQPISFFVENSEIKIEGGLKKVVISGSKIHSELLDINSQIDSLQIDGDKWELINSFIENNRESYLNPYLILTYVFNSATYEELNDFYDVMSPSLIQHRYSKRIENQLSVLKAVEIGQIAPNFIEKDTTGNVVSLKSYRGSYVLIDFWASWCGPCRAENPAMVKLYNELKTKNVKFEIIGVAGDFVVDRWKNAIIKDNLPWINISDLKGFDGKALKMYGIKSLPYTVLLDEKGEIIEKGLTGEDLRVKLKEIFEID